MSDSCDQTGDPAGGNKSSGRTLVLGVGNAGAGDDGFGPAVLAALADAGLPRGTELADGGVSGIDLLSEIEDFDRLILVDAVRARGTDPEELAGERGLEAETGRCRNWVSRPDPVPGGVVVFRLSEVELEDPDPRFSLHDLSFGGSLRLARTLGLRLPEIWIVGYVLDRLSSVEGPELGAGARNAVSAGVTAVKGLLAPA
jgi:hypothetical protein